MRRRKETSNPTKNCSPLAVINNICLRSKTTSNLQVPLDTLTSSISEKSYHIGNRYAENAPLTYYV